MSAFDQSLLYRLLRSFFRSFETCLTHGISPCRNRSNRGSFRISFFVRLKKSETLSNIRSLSGSSWASRASARRAVENEVYRVVDGLLEVLPDLRLGEVGEVGRVAFGPQRRVHRLGVGARRVRIGRSAPRRRRTARKN